MKTHKDLDAWKDSIKLVTELYRITKEFPKEELYGITSQIRRAAVSVPANISEGSARGYSIEFARYLRIAQASLAELETLLIISSQLDYLKEDTFNTMKGMIFKINAQISGLIRSLKKYIN
jgi:four helix bundle protein